MEVEELWVPIEEDLREDRPWFLALNKMRNYDSFSLELQKVAVEDDEPDKNFLFIVIPDLKISNGLLHSSLS